MQLYIENKQGKIYKFTSNPVESINIFACIYHSLQWEESIDLVINDDDPECLLLPLLDSFIRFENGDNNYIPKNYIITERWLEFDATFKPIMPRVDNKSIYNDCFI